MALGHFSIVVVVVVHSVHSVMVVVKIDYLEVDQEIVCHFVQLVVEIMRVEVAVALQPLVVEEAAVAMRNVVVIWAERVAFDRHSHYLTTSWTFDSQYAVKI